MDIFKLEPDVGDADTELTNGVPVNGWIKATWVERYQTAGEFVIEAPLSSGFKDFLPIGSFLSHVDSQEIMMVENHEIEQTRDKDPIITISGRSFIAYLENRTIGDPFVFSGSPNTVQEYILAADDSWDQIVTMITDHAITLPAGGEDNELISVNAFADCTGPSTSEARSIRAGTVYDRVLELLKIDDIGIATVRPTSLTSLINWKVYTGLNLSNIIRFSWINGDLDEINYLFSSKKDKTHARVLGRWVQVFVDGGVSPTNYDRRIMTVDASDLDSQFSAYPTGTDLTDVIAKMEVRGREAILNQNKRTISQTTVSPNTSFKFRRDYQIGDLVSVDGDFGASAIMRVVEFAQIQDENGASGYPTLAIPGEN